MERTSTAQAAENRRQVENFFDPHSQDVRPQPLKSKKPLTFKVVLLNDTATMPTRSNGDDSGWDLYASESAYVAAGDSAIIKTGIAIEPPSQHEAQVRLRSGVTSKTKLRTQFGTVDYGYRGEVGIMVDNIAPPMLDELFYIRYVRDDEPIKIDESGGYRINVGDKVAQLVFSKLADVAPKEIEAFDDTTERGEKGYGSSDGGGGL